jgi:hypothetical protein
MKSKLRKLTLRSLQGGMMPFGRLSFLPVLNCPRFINTTKFPKLKETDHELEYGDELNINSNVKERKGVMKRE